MMKDSTPTRGVFGISQLGLRFSCFFFWKLVLKFVQIGRLHCMLNNLCTLFFISFCVECTVYILFYINTFCTACFVAICKKF